MSALDGLANDWPSNAENDDDLAQFTEELTRAAPPLAPGALARVAERMRAEFERAERRQRWREVGFGVSMAAAILIAISAFAWLRGGSAVDRSPRTWGDDFKTQTTKIEPLIADDVAIAVAEGPPASVALVEKSLVQLEKYSSLFSD